MANLRENLNAARQTVIDARAHASAGVGDESKEDETSGSDLGDELSLVSPVSPKSQEGVEEGPFFSTGLCEEIDRSTVGMAEGSGAMEPAASSKVIVEKAPAVTNACEDVAGESPPVAPVWKPIGEPADTTVDTKVVERGSSEVERIEASSTPKQAAQHAFRGFLGMVAKPFKARLRNRHAMTTSTSLHFQRRAPSHSSETE